MSTITSLGFSIITKYNGAGAKAARKDLKQTGDTGASTSQKVGKAGKAVASGIGIIGAAAFKSALDYDKAVKTIRKGTGETGSSLAGLQKSFDNVNKSVAASAGDVASALSLLHTRTGATGKALEDLTKTELRLGSLTGEDMPNLIAKTTRVFGDWSIATNKQGQSLDWLYKVSQKTGIGVSELAQKTVEFGAPLRTMGFSFEEATAMLGKWEKEGVNTTMALGGMKIALGAFAKAGKDPKKSMMELFDQIKRAPTLGKAAAIAVASFGKRAGPDMADAIRGGKFDLQEFVNTLKKSPETIESAAKATGGFEGKLKLMKKSAELALIPLGQGLLTIFMAMAPTLILLAQQVGSLAERFNKLPGPVKTTLIVLTGFVLLLPKFQKIGAAVGKMIGGLVKAFMWLKNACIVTRVQLALLKIQAIAMAVWAKIVAAAQKVWAGAQWLLNAAMSANPLALVVIAVVALVAAIVIAYKKSDTFRKIVTAAWSAIKTGAAVAWKYIVMVINWAMAAVKVYISAGVAVFKVYAAMAIWLWKKVMAPVWKAIMVIFRIWWWGVKVYIALWIAAIKAMAAIGMWLWNKVMKPVWDGIKAVIRVAISIVKSYINAGIAVFKFYAKVAMWLWKNVMAPVWNAIRALIRSIVSAIKGHINSCIQTFKTLASVAGWLYRNGIKPAWNAIGSLIKSVWRNTISAAFNSMKAGVNSVKKGFETAKEGIGVAWNALKSITKAPVKFFVETVYNNGLRRAWNATAGKIPGVPDMAKASLPRGFAKGGYLGAGKKGPNDKVPIMAQAGEYMIRAKRVRELGKEWLDRLNHGSNVGGPHTTADGQGYALGGIIDPLKNLAKGALGGLKKGFSWATDFTRGIAAKALSGLFKPIRSLTNSVVDKFPGSGVVGTFVKQFANSGFDKMIDFVKGKAAPDGGAGNGTGGKTAAAGLRWARTQNGKRYQWGGNGNPSWDCSGFMSGIESVLRGQNPHRRWSTHSFRGMTAAPGWQQNLKSAFQIGVTNAGVGHTAGTLSGVNVESRGGKGVIVGSGARGWNNGLFKWHYGFKPLAYENGGMIPYQRMDSGGVLPRGLSLTNNTTGSPEALYRDRNGGTGGDVYNFDFRGAVVTGGTREFQNMVVGAMSDAEYKGRVSKGTMKRR